MAKRLNLLWLQSGGCGGCTMSLLNAEQPNVFDALNSSNINLLWHASLSDNANNNFVEIINDITSGNIQLDLLCIEGAAVTGPEGSGGFHMVSGMNIPMMTLIEQLAQKAQYTLAIGSCTAYGGMSRTNKNQTEVKGLQYIASQKGGLLGRDYLSQSDMPVINVAGCPAHPEWILHTIQAIALNKFEQTDIDSVQRPKFYTEHLAHHGCPKNEYYEYKASADASAQAGCLMENLGCKATQAAADCNIRLWNGHGSCPKAGYACINCTAPGFEEPGHTFCQTPKLAGIPIGLPTDMPKAWFIALSSLSKAATPERIKTNARSETINISPDMAKNKK